MLLVFVVRQCPRQMLAWWIVFYLRKVGTLLGIDVEAFGGHRRSLGWRVNLGTSSDTSNLFHREIQNLVVQNIAPWYVKKNETSI